MENPKYFLRFFKNSSLILFFVSFHRRTKIFAGKLSNWKSQNSTQRRLKLFFMHQVDKLAPDKLFRNMTINSLKSSKDSQFFLRKKDFLVRLVNELQQFSMSLTITTFFPFWLMIVQSTDISELKVPQMGFTEWDSKFNTHERP